MIGRPYPVTVAASGSQLIPRGGTYVYCIEANLLAFDILVDEADKGRCGPGLGYAVPEGEEPFGQVRVVNTAGVELTATLVIGAGVVLDNRLTLSGDLNLSTPTQLVSTADVALTASPGAAELILAANANRKRALITNLAGNAAVVRIGDANVDGSRGVQLAPGATLPLQTEAAVYGWTTAAQSVGVLEEAA